MADLPNLLPGVKVVSTRQATEANAAGYLVSGYAITFQLQDGETGSVFVPDAQVGNTQYVANSINEIAANLMAIKALGA